MWECDYSKVDPWVKQHKDGRYEDFKEKNPEVIISRWTFEKRRRLILKLPLAPSMKKGYRSPGTGGSRTKNSCIYSTLLSLPVADLEGKNPVEIVQTLIDHLNSALKLGLEAVQMTVVGNGGTPKIEIRRHSR